METHLKLPQPIFALVSLLLAEREVDKVSLFLLHRTKWNHVLVHLAEVVSRVLILTGTQTLFVRSKKSCSVTVTVVGTRTNLVVL